MSNIYETNAKNLPVIKNYFDGIIAHRVKDTKVYIKLLVLKYRANLENVIKQLE